MAKFIKVNTDYKVGDEEDLKWETYINIDNIIYVEDYYIGEGKQTSRVYFSGDTNSYMIIEGPAKSIIDKINKEN